jgi:predicted HAD superfamily hydrolase
MAESRLISSGALSQSKLEKRIDGAFLASFGTMEKQRIPDSVGMM